eukprot:GHVS01075534.1.p1 GENE.GHVS01075534.1~~GHVS01075534.1.p1  ORF type:complete len:227 (+),score=64.83 GHVS01075534.1:57-737(+)
MSLSSQQDGSVVIRVAELVNTLVASTSSQLTQLASFTPFGGTTGGSYHPTTSATTHHRTPQQCPTIPPTPTAKRPQTTTTTSDEFVEDSGGGGLKRRRSFNSTDVGDKNEDNKIPKTEEGEQTDQIGYTPKGYTTTTTTNTSTSTNSLLCSSIIDNNTNCCSQFHTTCVDLSRYLHKEVEQMERFRVFSFGSDGVVHLQADNSSYARILVQQKNGRRRNRGDVVIE